MSIESQIKVPRCSLHNSDQSEGGELELIAFNHVNTAWFGSSLQWDHFEGMEHSFMVGRMRLFLN